MNTENKGAASAAPTAAGDNLDRPGLMRDREGNIIGEKSISDRDFLRPLLEPGAPDGTDGTDGATAPVRQRGTAVHVPTGPGSESAT